MGTSAHRAHRRVGPRRGAGPRRVEDAITRDLAAAGIPAGGANGGNLNLNVLPDTVPHIVRAAYGDATGHVFLISAGVAVVGVVAALLLTGVESRNKTHWLPGRFGE